MKKIKRNFVFVFALSLLVAFTSMTPVYAEDNNDYELSIAELLFHKQAGSETDVLRMMAKIKKEYPAEYELQKAVLDYWQTIDETMVLNEGVAPDGLPQDNSHAFVVLGFELNADGSMKEELIGRLEVAKATAKKYPLSTIIVTGGAVVNEKREADLMADWLRANGLDDNRLLIENQSNSTSENAQFTFDILHAQSNIKTYSVISSLYHLKRSAITYYAESLKQARERSIEPLQLVGNAGWNVDNQYDEIQLFKAASLAEIFGVFPELYKMVYEAAPASSKLMSLSLLSPKKNEYIKGEELDLSGLQVIANYDLDAFTRDMTSSVIVDGYDKEKLGMQSIRVTYTENGIKQESYFSINVSLEKASISSDIPKTGDTSTAAFYASLLIICTMGIVAVLKQKKYQ